jgi:acetate kinase
VIGDDGVRRDGLSVDGVGATATLSVDGQRSEIDAPDLGRAVVVALEALDRRGLDFSTVVAVGHRVVHGGDRYTDAVVVDQDVEAGIEALARLAPLHNPPALDALRAARARLPDIPHVAVFDTAFHATLPRAAREYALPATLRDRMGLRRFGFHGTSHDYVTSLAAEHLGHDRRTLRIVSAHLGAGASMTAVEHGLSVDTSMGYTPLEGLVMATRSGDVDPGIVLALLREGHTADEVDQILNRASGLLGMTGSADLRAVEERAANGDDDARLALALYIHRIRKYIGAYAAVMGGIDVLVFTAGVGQNSVTIRRRVLERLDFLGIECDEDLNRDVRVTAARPVADISRPHARCRVLVVATDEEVAIARAARRLLQADPVRSPTPPLPIAISARHVHLSSASVATLFGPGHHLTPDHAISQPGQFAARERITLRGPKGSIEHVRVVGPERADDQVEISRTDEFLLGIDAPVRESGDLSATPGIVLEGPCGERALSHGVIVALRHIHMTPADAQRYGVADGDTVDVDVTSPRGRSLTFGEVRVRVNEHYRLEMHVDTDEANAAGIERGTDGVLERVAHSATVRTRR